MYEIKEWLEKINQIINVIIGVLNNQRPQLFLCFICIPPDEINTSLTYSYKE